MKNALLIASCDLSGIEFLLCEYKNEEVKSHICLFP